MNAQSQVFELDLEGNEVEEAVRAIFHTVLVHRVYPKVTIKGSDVWSFGSIGFNDADCDFLDLTYVHVTCDEVVNKINEPVHSFVEALRAQEANPTVQNTPDDSSLWGRINLEFFEQKRSHWPFSGERLPWELWSVKVNVLRLETERDRQVHRAKVSQTVADQVLHVSEVMNRADVYHPKLGKTSEFEITLDMNQPLCTPHLFRIYFETSTDANVTPVGTAMKIMIKNSLNMS